MILPVGLAGRSGLVVVGLTLSLAAAWMAVSGVDLTRTGEVVAGADLRYLGLVLVVLAVQVVVRSARWRVLLPLGRLGRPPIRRIVPVALVGYLGNAVLPARLGEVVRSVVLARREGLSISDTLGSAVLERVLDTLVVAVLGILAAIAIGAEAWVLQAALAALAISLVALVVLALAPRLLGRIGIASLAQVREAIARLVRGAMGQGPRAIAFALLLTGGAWILDAGMYWLVARSLGIGIDPVGAVLVSTVAVLSTAIPSAPGYLGTFELALVAAAAALGIDRDTGLAFALVGHAVAVAPVAIAGGIAAAAMGVGVRRPAVVG